MKKIVALVLFAAGIATAVKAADYDVSAIAPSPRTDATWTPINAEPVVPVQSTIEVAPVVITARMPRKAVAPVRQTSQCGAFTARPLTQGSGSVRGFCTQ